MNPKSPTSREKQEHGDSGHAVYRSWCAACVEGRGVGGQHRIELLEEEERVRTTPIVAFDYGFLNQENADTFPTPICRNSKYGQTGAKCCERKGPTACSISFLVGVIKDLGFRRVIHIIRCSQRAPEYEPRRFHVLSADIEAHGHTGGCPGCAALASHGRVTKPQNDECRERI